MVLGMLPDPRVSRVHATIGAHVNNQKKVPPCVRTTRRYLALCFPVTLAVGLVGIAGIKWRAVYVGYYWLLGSIALSFCVLSLVWWVSRRERRLHAKLISKRYALCPNCLYDLSGRPDDSHRCPECGEIFDPTDWEGFVPIRFTCRQRRRVHPGR